MESAYGQDLSSIDMDDLGVRPIDWFDLEKTFDQSFEDLFGKEKPTDFNVYSVEVQKNLFTNENEAKMSDDEDDNEDYEVDPETGEKIFRETTTNSAISLSPSDDTWIEEYLSNIESATTNTNLPLTTNQSEFLLEDPNWLDQIFELDDTSNSAMIHSTDHLSQEITTTNSLTNDDEYSTSNSYQQQYENNNEITLVEAKLEKLEPDESSMSNMFSRRSSVRSSNQGQLDEETLRQHEIPLTVQDITDSTTEEYNRHLARLSYLTTEKIHIIKDIRRRGKNKVAAQNCRKRKAVSVEALLEEVDELKRVKHELEERKRAYQQQITETRHQYEYLHRQVLPDRQLPPTIIVK